MPYRAAGLWREETILDDLRRATSATPAKPAIIGWRDGRPELERVTYGELTSLVDRMGAGLAELGVGPGDVVSVQLPNRWQFVALHLAIVRIGAVTNPISPILRRREVRTILQRSASSVFVGVRRHRAFDVEAMIAGLRDELPQLRRVLFADGSLEDTLCAPAWEERRSPADLDALAPAADGLCELQFTSGTSGEAKGVWHTHNSIYAGMRGVRDVVGLTGDDTILMAATFGHQTGFLFGCCMPILSGATVVLQESWDPVAALDAVDRCGVTWTSCAPTMALDLCGAARQGGRGPSTLQAMRVSGGHVPASLVDAARADLDVELLASWGLTETGVCTLASPGEPAGAGPSDGVPLPGVELRVSPDAGVVSVRTPGMFAGYLGQEPGLGPDGWLDTGDLAHIDGEGRIRITGRQKDLIIRGGENVPVGLIETLLAQCPQMDGVTLIPVRDERLGERACAVVVPAPGTQVDLADLTDALSEAGVAKQFWPERLEVVDRLPMTSSGKVRKAELRQRLGLGS